MQLRDDAFPHQKIGVSGGRVVRVASVSGGARDLPKGLALDDPVFRIIVELDQQTIRINEVDHPLRAGMTLKADIVLERRRVIEYLLAPFFAFAERNKT